MSIVKKILIFVTVVIFLVVLWRLIVVRMALRKSFGPGNNIPGTNIEGLEPFSFLSTNEAVELRRVENSSKITVKSAPSSIRDLSLSELCVKASYNSAISGNYVNLDMLGYVIGRGCRYLDFEILYVPIDESSAASNQYAPMKPVVGFTNATDYSTVGSYNTIVLDKVLGYAVATAFSPSCPNHKDPLFINLRVKSNNTSIYPDIAAALDNSIGPKIYSDTAKTVYTNLSTYTGINPALPVTKNTLLGDIMGKVVVLIDKTIYPNYVNYTSNCPHASTAPNGSGPCYDLANYVNAQNGSQDTNLVLYSFVTVKPPIQILDDDVHTTVQNITVANPDNMFLMNPANKNPNYGDYILKYGCQWVPYRFYQNDVALETYEKFFNDHGSGFVPMVSAISYFMNMG